MFVPGLTGNTDSYGSGGGGVGSGGDGYGQSGGQGTGVHVLLGIHLHEAAHWMAAAACNPAARDNSVLEPYVYRPQTLCRVFTG